MKNRIPEDDLAVWRVRVQQARQIARLVAAGRRVFLIATARGLTPYPPPLPGRLILDNHGQPLYRVIGEVSR